MNTNDLKARIQASVRRVPSRTRADVADERRVLGLASFAIAAALYLAFDGPRHGQGRPTWFFVASIATWIGVAAAAMRVASGSGRSALGPSPASLVAVALGTPAILLAVSLLFAETHPEIVVLGAERIGLKCLGLSLAAAACPLVGLAIIRRSSVTAHGHLAGAALGAASGACGGVMVELWCPVAAPAHVLVGHILPILVLAVLGAALGGGVMAIRLG